MELQAFSMVGTSEGIGKMELLQGEVGTNLGLRVH